ncbi:MAG: hypothetical protein NZM26_04965 [Patescibacteria group bacterium]|nr:hypothetical protein [Patescibacteria group bacterium]
MKNKNTLFIVLLVVLSIGGGLFLTLRSDKSVSAPTSQTYLPPYEQPLPAPSADIDETSGSLNAQFDEEDMLFKDEVSDYDLLVSENSDLDALGQSYVKSEF